LGSRYGLKNLLELEKNIFKYVSKNTPAGLPEVAAYTKKYIRALLGSDLLRESLDALDACFGTDLELNTDPQKTQTKMRFDEVLKEWVEDTEEMKKYIEKDAMHFILRDFCSVVGFVYKPEYKEPILRSLVRKDTQFYRWLFEYLGFPVSYVEIMRNATDSAVSFTDEITEVDGFKELVSLTDEKGAYTDLFVQGYLAMVLFFDEEKTEEMYLKLEEWKDLLVLVLPARLFISFRPMNFSKSLE